MVDVVFWVSLAAIVALIVFLGRFSYRDWKRRVARRQESERVEKARKLQDEINERFEESKRRIAEKAEKAAVEAAETRRHTERLQRAGVIQLGAPPSSFGNRKERRAKAAIDRKKR
jgi:hypothetical protein